MPRREPAGSPTGGQFTTTRRTEPGLTLAAGDEVTRDRALSLAAREVLDADPTARGLLLHQDTTGPVPVVVAYMAQASDGSQVWLDPDVADAVNGHLGALTGLGHALQSTVLTGAEDGPNGVWLPLGRVAPASAA